MTTNLYRTSMGLKVGSTKQLPPTLNLQYYFLGSDSNFRPYAGEGICKK